MTKRLSTRLIRQTVADRHGIDLDMVELYRDQGTWFWAGKVGALFSGTEIVYGRLDTFPLERWVEDFDHRVDELLDSPFASGTLREQIEKVNWDA